MLSEALISYPNNMYTFLLLKILFPSWEKYFHVKRDAVVGK